MGLYLCAFDGDEELDGVEVGPYADFAALRDYVTGALEGGSRGSLFPVFILHHDSDGEWSVDVLPALRRELAEISARMKVLPPTPFSSDWMRSVARGVGHTPKNAYESFLDVDGEVLLDRMQALVQLGIARNVPILFQ